MATELTDSIRVLPPELAEKIAAGEVIERPGSVLKELVENCIDAGASRIAIDVDDAGFASMRVSDNGRGMSRENLQKSILRHATSKIASLSDLMSLHTMGFRGEALASIVAVSRSEVCTSAADDGTGQILEIAGGVPQDVRPTARVRGTTITVRDLFFNTPARKKFMKSRRSERAYLVRLVEQLATPFLPVHFTLALDGVVELDAPAVGSFRERIAQVAGHQYASTLCECSGDIGGDAHVTVLVSLPEHTGARPRFQDLYVNLRRVDCDAVTYAIRAACQPFFPPNLRPSFIAFLDIDPSRVDVNIHPTKQKVKFDDERWVAGGVHRVVERALKQALVPLPAEQSAVHLAPTYPTVVPADLRTPPPVILPQPQALFAEAQAETQVTLNFSGGGVSSGAVAQSDETSSGNWDLITCFQVHNLFILAPIRNGLLLIDQHAAHERILFEQALGDLSHGQAASQQMLFPVVVELSLTEKSVVTSSVEVFRKLGYTIDDFGGGSVSVSSIPTFVKPGYAERSVREIVAFLLDETSMRQFPQPHERYAAAFACGCAIKQGQELTREEMSSLLNTLFATRNPYTCPHGRPTVTRLSLDEIKRRFLR